MKDAEVMRFKGAWRRELPLSNVARILLLSLEGVDGCAWSVLSLSVEPKCQVKGQNLHQIEAEIDENASQAHLNVLRRLVRFAGCTALFLPFWHLDLDTIRG